jgi:hypothetical protein
MVNELAQLPPEIWMTLFVEAKNWLINERNFQVILIKVAKILLKFLKRIDTFFPHSQINMEESNILIMKDCHLILLSLLQSFQNACQMTT